jgi:hypothetical protein
MRRIVGFVGGYLIDMGAIALEDLDRGLEEQLRLAAQGRDVRVGQVLIELGLITPAQLQEALALQSREEKRRQRAVRAKPARGRKKKR